MYVCMRVTLISKLKKIKTNFEPAYCGQEPTRKGVLFAWG